MAKAFCRKHRRVDYDALHLSIVSPTVHDDARRLPGPLRARVESRIAETAVAGGGDVDILGTDEHRRVHHPLFTPRGPLQRGGVK